jgi:hypothetical protein
MAKNGWILPVVFGGLAIWACGGWMVYGALQGLLRDEPVAEAIATEPNIRVSAVEQKPSQGLLAQGAATLPTSNMVE